MRKLQVVGFVFLALSLFLLPAGAREQPVVIDDMDTPARPWEFRADGQSPISGQITLPDQQTRVEGSGSMRIDYRGLEGADGGAKGNCYAILFPAQDWSKVEKVIFWVKGTANSSANQLQLFVEGGGTGAKAASYRLGAVNQFVDWQLVEIPIAQLSFQPRDFVYSLRFWISGVRAGDQGTVWVDYFSTIGLGNLEAEVTDKETNLLPVANAQVELGGKYKSYLAITDSTGKLSLANVIAGEYSYTVYAAGYQTLQGRVTVEEGATTALTPSLTAFTGPTLTAFTVSPSLFAPNLGGTAEIRYRLTRPALVKLELLREGGNDVLQGETVQAAGEYRWLWNGRAANGDLLAPGSYQLHLIATRGTKVEEKTATVEIGASGPRLAFSPNGDGNNDEMELRLYAAELARITFRIFDAQGKEVYQADLGQRSGEVLLNWNGYDLGGKLCSEGRYRYVVEVTSFNTSTYTGEVVLDVTPPKPPLLLAPTPGYQAASLGPVHFEWRTNEEGTSIFRYGQQKDLRDAVEIPVDNSRSLSREFQMGHTWYWQVVAIDPAGNRSEPSTISSFTVTPLETGRPGVEFLGISPNPFSPDGDSYRDEVAISYKTLRPAQVKIQIRNLAGQVIWRSPVSLQLAGDQVVWWDGRDLRGRLARTGLYIVEVEARAEGDWPAAKAWKVISLIR